MNHPVLTAALSSFLLPASADPALELTGKSAGQRQAVLLRTKEVV